MFRRIFSRSKGYDLFELAFQASPIGFALVDKDGSWIKINEAVCAVLERDADDILAHKIQDYTPIQGGLEDDMRWMQECLDGMRTGYRMHKSYRMPCGRLKPVVLSVAIVRRKRKPPVFIKFIIPMEEEEYLRKELQHALERETATRKGLETEIKLLRSEGQGRFADDFDSILKTYLPNE